MRIKNKRAYYLKRKTIVEDNEGGKYEDFEKEGLEIKANISPASGRLQAEIYGERLSYILNMLIEGPYTVEVREGITYYILIDGTEFCEGYGICYNSSKESNPDYKIISIKPYSHLFIELEKI